MKSMNFGLTKNLQPIPYVEENSGRTHYLQQALFKKKGKPTLQALIKSMQIAYLCALN